MYFQSFLLHKMIVSNEFLKKLRSAFDLNIYEAKIWTALLSKGIATAGELSDISDVPRSRSYDVLESLEKRGFVIMKLGKPIKYIAVEPSEIVKRVKKGLKKDAEEHIKLLEKVSTTSTFDELNVLYKNGINHVDPVSISGSIKGRSNLYNHISTMLSNAKKSVVIVTSSKGLKRKANNFMDIFRRLSSKGVKVRIVANMDKNDDKLVKQLQKYVDVKTFKGVDARFILVDNKELLFMVNSDEDIHENYDIGIWANTPFFAEALGTMFETNWKKAK